jgi:hypothetical protein
MTAVATKLREARALIERGWVQTTYACANRQTGGLCYCLYGAINEAVVGNPFDDCQDATTEYEEMLARAIGYDPLFSGSLHEWNDAPERTQADVLAAFDRAIELAEQEAR